MNGGERLNHYRTRLMEVLRECPAERYVWLQQSIARILDSPDPSNELTVLSAMARRKMGDCPMPEVPITLETPAGQLSLDHWSTADFARVVLILAAIDAEAEPQAVETLFRQGDEAERATIVRALVLFDDGVRLKPLIAEAGRANSLELVSAVSLRNPYPTAYYTEHEFNQMVLKCLFMGQPIDKIPGLEARGNPELSRMCEDYFDERTAAGRDVPCDIWLAMGPHASERAEKLMCEYLSHDNTAHRCYSGIAIGHRLKRHPQLRKHLENQIKIETDAGVTKALQTALAADTGPA